MWVREADEQFSERIMMSAHIDDTLILCKCLKVMEAFKRHLLSRFDGTDEGEVTEYLGCVIERDRAAGTITLSQKHYSKRILALYNMQEANHRKTPLEPGVQLSKQDSPATPDPALHCMYRGIIGHLSFLVMMTRPDSAFAFAELSRFVQAPGEVHMKSARHILAYLAGTSEEGVTYSAPTDAKDLNCLHGWVDSDYAADPDTRRSVSGYLISMNNGPISWCAKRQSCTTRSVGACPRIRNLDSTRISRIWRVKCTK